MYAVAVKRGLTAQHFLIGGDWGQENERHFHHYVVEVCLEGRTLDEHGYLVDIVEIETHMDELVSYFQDKTLNELPEFGGLNPSVERFARIFCQEMGSRISNPNVCAINVTVWENEQAYAAYRQDR